MFSPPSSCLTWCGGWPPELSLWITVFRDPCSMWDLEIHRELLIGYFPTWEFRAFQQSPWLYWRLFFFWLSHLDFVPQVLLWGGVWRLSFLNGWRRCLSVLGRLLRILMMSTREGLSLRSARLSCSVLLLQKYEWYLMALFRAWALRSKLFL